MTFEPTSRLTAARAADAGVLTLTLAGELDVEAEREIRAWFEEHADAHAEDGAPCVELDLRDVAFADSAGLRALINADALARRGGWELRILVADGQVLDTLRSSNLLDMLPVYAESEAEAA